MTDPTRATYIGRYALPSKGAGAIAQHFAKKREDLTEDDVNSIPFETLRGMKGFGDESIMSLVETRFNIATEVMDAQDIEDIFGDEEEVEVINPVTKEGLLVPLGLRDIGWLENLNKISYNASVEQGAARILKQWMFENDPSKVDRPDTNMDHLLGGLSGTEQGKQGAASNTAPAIGENNFAHTFTSKEG